jgi:hypothetical protein
MIVSHEDRYSRLGDDTVYQLTLESPFVDWGLDGDGGDVRDDTVHQLTLESPFVDWGIDRSGSVGGGERVHCIWMSRLVGLLKG